MLFSRFFLSLALLPLCSQPAEVRDITPRIGSVEVYGARKVPPEKIKLALGARPGDVLPSRIDAEERIDRVPGVLLARVEAACCRSGRMVLYVGVEERDTPHMEYHETPTGTFTLPPKLYESYGNFLGEVGESIRAGNADEDLTQGYSLMKDPECRSLQKAFLEAVAADLPTLDRVVRESADPEQRAAAAYLLQYAPRGPHTTSLMVNALQYALRDTDDNVRENAVHALKAVAVGAKLHPDQPVRLEPTWFVELLNSIVFSDRRDASLALVDMTENRDPDALALIRERALPSVVEMARWQDLDRALPAFILAGRVAGLDEAAIKTAWLSGDREPVLSKLAKSTGKHSARSAMVYR